MTNRVHAQTAAVPTSLYCQVKQVTEKEPRSKQQLKPELFSPSHTTTAPTADAGFLLDRAGVEWVDIGA